jgi:hypothetical protein
LGWRGRCCVGQPVRHQRDFMLWLNGGECGGSKITNGDLGVETRAAL